jgi:Ca2+-binding RTX toxin-like protein
MNKYGTPGTDWIYGTGDTDMLAGFDGGDYLYGGAGEDLLIGGAGPDVLYGDTAYTHGTERDMAAYWDSPVGVTVNLTFGTGSAGTAEGDILIDIESVWGSEYQDILIGNALDNDLLGAGGDDYLMGFDGNDNLNGGLGNDVLVPGSGTDFLNGGVDGNDTVWYYGAWSGVWASLLYGGISGDAAGDTYLWVDNLIGTNYSDYLQGDNFANLLSGGSGDDWLWGEDGDDTLVGGEGIDVLTGGAGADTFAFRHANDTSATLTTADLIWDFDPSQDLLDLTQIDADVTTSGRQGFEFIGLADFTAPGQVRWSIEGSETVVWMNTDGDPTADAAIRLAGAPLLGADHFLV